MKNKNWQIKGPTEIVTDRMILRRPDPQYASLVFEAVMESWDQLTRWSIWTLDTRENVTINHYKDFCARKKEQFDQSKDMTFLAFDRDNCKLLGGGGLHHPNWGKGSLSLGFWIATSETGKGYGKELAGGLVTYAFNELQATKVEASYQDGNDASAAVLRSVGFVNAPMEIGDSSLYRRSSTPMVQMEMTRNNWS